MQNYVEYKGERIEYSIVYRKRKSVGISVDIREGIKVSAPNWVGKKQIQAIVSQKAEWIFKKLEELSERQITSPGKELVDGAELLFLGRVLHLRIEDAPNIRRLSIKLVDDMLIVNLPLGLDWAGREEKVKGLVIQWYKGRALEILDERVRHFSDIMEVKASQIRVKQQKTRWGSCSSRGNINFNWKLAMFPVEIIDYVVVHELAHLKLMNHSKSFWEVVEGVIPDYKERMKKLKKYAEMLELNE